MYEKSERDEFKRHKLSPFVYYLTGSPYPESKRFELRPSLTSRQRLLRIQETLSVSRVLNVLNRSLFRSRYKAKKGLAHQCRSRGKVTSKNGASGVLLMGMVHVVAALLDHGTQVHRI
jgi:hypothetical protein